MNEIQDLTYKDNGTKAKTEVILVLRESVVSDLVEDISIVRGALK